jgi:hypothetical protein
MLVLYTELDANKPIILTRKNKTNETTENRILGNVADMTVDISSRWHWKKVDECGEK